MRDTRQHADCSETKREEQDHVGYYLNEAQKKKKKKTSVFRYVFRKMRRKEMTPSMISI